MNFFNNLKLRVSYGITGNQGIPPYSTLAQLGSSAVIINGSVQNGIVQTALATPDLKWEQTKAFNLGLDFGFLYDTVNFSANYYHKRTSNLLLDAEVPYVTGFTTRIQNSGVINNEGLEFSADATIISNRVFNWNTSLNISTNRNKVVKLVGGKKEIIADRLSTPSNDVTSRLIVGKPVGTFVGYIYQGVNSKTGAPIFKDINGDGEINDDEVVIGDATPDFYGGIQNTLQYKNLSLSIYLQGSYGNDLYNKNLFRMADPTINFYSEFRDNRWRSESNPGKYPPPGATGGMYNSNSVFVEDGSYLRLKTLQLSYSLPNNIVQGIRDLRLFFTGTNLLLIKSSDFLNYDPEVSQYGTNPIKRGFSSLDYPQNRSYMVGFEIKF